MDTLASTLVPAAAADHGLVADAAQQELLQLGPGHGPVLVLGGPGTGKTTTLLRVLTSRLDTGLDPQHVLVLSPTRSAAATLRDDLSAGTEKTFSEPAVRTWSAYAFDLIRRARLDGLLPALQRPPRLLSGPEQDTLIGHLLEGHALGITPAPEWPESLGEAIGTRGFRKELRELFDRISEHGLEAGALQDLGESLGRPEWVAAAQFYQEYRDLLDLGSAEAFDPAGLLAAAAGILEHNPGFLAAEHERLHLVMVDDLQEANPAQHRLLSLLARGRDLVAFAVPDNVVQGFRGARPDMLGEFDARLGTERNPSRILELKTSYRLNEELATAWGRVARRIPVAAGGAGRILDFAATEAAEAHPAAAEAGEADDPDVPAPGSLEVLLVDSPIYEQRLVAQRLLEEHLIHHRPLDSMAVILRNGSQVRSMAKYLAGSGIAVNTPPAETPLREEPAVRPLLDLMGLALAPEAPQDPLLLQELLMSRYANASALDVRRLRQGLRRHEVARGGNRSSAELLTGMLDELELLESMGREAAGARRLARMYQALRTELAGSNVNAETALWALWAASGMAQKWTEAALAGGILGARADHDLDAMLAIFQSAERFVDQLPGSSVAQFVEHVLGQELPMDTLASRGGSAASVQVLTTAAAAGREWDLVLVPGMQEGIWPNTKLRGELLGGGALSDVIEHGPQILPVRNIASLIRETRADELRTFANAISRARSKVVAIAVASEDTAPSSFLDIVDPDGANQGRRAIFVPRPRTLGALVAELRQAAEATALDEDRGQLHHDATSVLGALVASPHPVRGAHPASWWGLAESTSSGPVVPPGDPVKVSPSKVEAVMNSPLNWFVQAAGGEAATDFARSLGTLVHSIAEEHPEASGGEYLQVLEGRWGELEMPENWEGARDRERAESMLKKLAQYNVMMRTENRRLIGREIPFEVTIPAPSTAGDPAPDPAALPDPQAPRAALLRGVVDRVEADAAGNPWVVDLKTGKSQPSGKDVERHPQLGAYQAAVINGALAGKTAEELTRVPAGASLVQLGTSTKSPREQAQPAITEEDWATPMVLAAAQLMGDADFLSRHDPARGGRSGSNCRLPGICPLCSEGRQVTEP
ncbi:ATP-dependent helicase [Paeniglutamicibacter quisquiliarum]|uniref:ATP-dependent helicase n=1 Tax=Paeniglutamicibacter quisquiliarum TaxID=2849498 RepID=UPI0020C54CA9|nr:PD-(D/E)XK nuclease family protein [Paeniglutamicibacter quisquiliarum]